MNWDEYSNLRGQHSLLSASNNSWTNYDTIKFIQWLYNSDMKERGTRLHAYASEAIQLKRKQADVDNISSFINDCIDMNMHSEVVLFYSKYAFVTADAITDVDDTVYIFDLKTGQNPANFRQLYVYAAYYCLRNKINPFSYKYVFRIYQFEEYEELEGDPNEVKRLVDLIVEFEGIIRSTKEVNGV